MKLAFLIFTLVLGQVASAQTLRERKIKEEMLQRVDDLISKAEIVESKLKTEKGEYPNTDQMRIACDNIDILFTIYPEHIRGIGGNLDLFDKHTISMKDESKSHLMYLHTQSRICRKGTDFEYVDPDEVGKEMKKIIKSLAKQKKRIHKASADYNNTYYFDYEY